MNREEILQKLLTYVATELLDGDDSELTESTPLLEWGVIDSMSMITILAFIENDIGVEVPDEMVRPEYFETLHALTELILEIWSRTPLPGGDPAFPVQSIQAANASHGIETVAVPLAPGDPCLICRAAGPAPQWLLIPAPMNPSMAWGAVLRTMVDEHETIAMALKGFEAGDDGLQVVPFGEQVDRALHLVREYMHGPVVLVGNGLGGAIAAEVARAAPERVRGLVVLGFGQLRDPRAWWQGVLELSKDPDRYLAATFFRPPPLSKPLQRMMRHQISTETYRSLLDDDAFDRLQHLFDDLTCPTLFIGGKNDQMVPRSAILAASERIPGSRVAWLDRCGHFPHMERSQEMLSLIRTFVDSVGGA